MKPVEGESAPEAIMSRSATSRGAERQRLEGLDAAGRSPTRDDELAAVRSDEVVGGHCAHAVTCAGDEFQLLEVRDDLLRALGRILGSVSMTSSAFYGLLVRVVDAREALDLALEAFS